MDSAAKDLKTIMCSCLVTARPMIFSLLLGSRINDCKSCAGVGWVEEHPFEGKTRCRVCGWSKKGHAEA